MPFTPWQPGMTITAGRMNLADMIGTVVFLAGRAAVQSIPTGTDAAANAMSWDTPTLDLLSGWAGGQPTRWTAPAAGWYTLAGAVSFAGSSAGTVRECLWYVNGANFATSRSRPLNLSSLAASPLTVDARTIPRLLAAGDYVTLVPAQNTGGALDTATGTYQPFMSVTYSGPP